MTKNEDLKPTTVYDELFSLVESQTGKVLLHSEMNDIINVVEKYSSRPTVTPSDAEVTEVLVCYDCSKEHGTYCDARPISGKCHFCSIKMLSDRKMKLKVATTDGDAERALDELIRQATSADRVLTAEDETKLIEAEETIRTALQSTCKQMGGGR